MPKPKRAAVHLQYVQAVARQTVGKRHGHRSPIPAGYRNRNVQKWMVMNVSSQIVRDAKVAPKHVGIRLATEQLEKLVTASTTSAGTADTSVDSNKNEQAKLLSICEAELEEVYGHERDQCRTRRQVLIQSPLQNQRNRNPPQQNSALQCVPSNTP